MNSGAHDNKLGPGETPMVCPPTTTISDAAVGIPALFSRTESFTAVKTGLSTKQMWNRYRKSRLRQFAHFQ